MDTSVGRWVRRGLTAGWATVWVAPVTSAVAIARAGWTPVVDNALIAAMTLDSLTADPPLVGMPTSLGLESGIPMSHPGPLGFWLLAPTARLLGEPGHGLLVGTVLLSVASIAAIAVLLRRRHDEVLEGVALLLVAAMVAALSGGLLSSPLNTHLAVLPLLLCLVATSGVAAGHHRQLWVVVLSGSLAAQVHLGSVVIVATLVLVSTACVAVDAVRRPGPLRRRLVRRIVPIGVALGVAAWIGPILDQLFGTGNLTRLARSSSAEQSPAGFDHGLDLAVEMTSFPPRWLLGRAHDEDLADPGALRVALSVAAVGTLLAVVVLAVRRRDRPTASLGAVALVGVAAATLTSARLIDPLASPYFTPQNALLYRLFWWPVGAMFAIALVRGVVGTLAATRTRRAPGAVRSPAQTVAVAASAFALVALGSAGHVSPPPQLGSYFAHETVNANAIAALPGRPDRVTLRFELPSGRPPAARPSGVWDTGPGQRYAYALNLVAQLRLRGIEVRFAEEPFDGITFSLAYRDDHRGVGSEDPELLFVAGPGAAHARPPGYTLLSRSGAGADVAGFSVATAVYVRSED